MEEKLRKQKVATIEIIECWLADLHGLSRKVKNLKAENERLKEEREKWKALEREKYKGWAKTIKDNQ